MGSLPGSVERGRLGLAGFGWAWGLLRLGLGRLWLGLGRLTRGATGRQGRRPRPTRTSGGGAGGERQEEAGARGEDRDGRIRPRGPHSRRRRRLQRTAAQDPAASAKAFLWGEERE